MKKLMSSMLAIAAMASMISCSTEDILNQETPGTDNNGLVPIKMTAEIGHLTTKGAIGQETGGNLSADLEGVYFLKSNGNAANWTTLDGPLQATIKKDGTITFNETLYYEKDGSKTHLIGYYPIATTTANNIVEWTITGKEDIIISDLQSGDKTTTGNLTFKFEHKLTQLKFNIKAPTELTGEKLTSIKVNKLRTAAQFNPGASSNQFTFTGNPTESLTAENPKTDADISVTGISGGTLLIESSEAAADFEIEVVTTEDGTNKTKTYKGTVNIGAETGKSYDVNLTISQQTVSGTATIGEWLSGGEVNKDII